MGRVMATPYTVTVHPYEADSRDAHGNLIDRYGEPIAQPVYGWHPHGESTEQTGSSKTVVETLRLLTPPQFAASPRDQITLPDGRRYNIVGEPADYTHNPFRYAAGKTVTIQRIQP